MLIPGKTNLPLKDCHQHGVLEGYLTNLWALHVAVSRLSSLGRARVHFYDFAGLQGVKKPFPP